MNAFLRACEADEPLQVAIRGPVGNDSEVRLLHQPFALVGRDTRADILLDHTLVSRRHLYLQIIKGETFWIDLDSRSGTFAEGQLRDSGWLDQGKLIRVGPFGLERLQRNRTNRTSGAESRISPLIARSLGGRPLPQVSLEFLNGPLRSASWPMNRVMSLVGSTSGCKFRLDDPSVAPFHCCLLRTSLGLWVTDLLGQDGIDVNESVHRYALLADNDVLRIGRYRIRIHSRVVAAEPVETASVGKASPAKELVPQRRRTVSSALDIPPQGSGVFNGSTIAALSAHLAPRPSSAQTADPRWPSSANESVLLENGNISESLLVSVVNQFGLMQQQMLDQFQQTISILVQTFGNLHREQMDTIRQELDEIRNLTREFQSLKVELDARARVQPAPARAGQGPLSLPGDDPAPDLVFSGEASEGASVTDVRSNLSSARDRVDDLLGSTPPVAPARAAPLASSSAVSSPKHNDDQATARQQGSSDHKPESERDMVVWLHQRMVHLQQERESRWQKILKLLPGLS
jgi:pSer/pThr/pTyr-binding forkhead associated (FHA) protein